MQIKRQSDIFEKIGVERMSFEESLVWHASPTLASLKVANLYSFKFRSMDDCAKTVEHFNSLMNPKGIYIELLRNTNDFYLIYVYRKKDLQRELHNIQVQNFLKEYGYSDEIDVREYLTVLKKRLDGEKDFPHEIGVFLGYPLADVKAFIEMKGKDFVLCGDWKVYHDKETARCLFCKYKRCKEIYVKVYEQGRKFSDMLVGA